MSSLDRATRSQPRHEARGAERHELQSGELPANDNASAYIETWPDGDPHVFARALARVLVRRALQDAGAMSAGERSNPLDLVG